MFHSFFRLLIFMVWLVCDLSALFSQHATGRFDATEVSEELVFDVNDLPLARGFTNDLNLAPNVVFSQDSSRAFVSFPSTDKVAVFDVPSGGLVQLLEVPDNPTQLTVTPDGRKVAVPCVLLSENQFQGDGTQSARAGAISIIDMETLDVRNIHLEDTVFSFLNNIVFSSDSSTGFIASSATDEILRFDVVGASEIDGRIALETGTRPTSITMSPDSSFFGVVLVQSGAIPVNEVPDSIVIVDTETFQVRKRLSFTVEEGGIPYNYLATNNIAFSPDGKFALIGENSISLAGGSDPNFVPGPVPDLVLLIDMEIGELVTVFGVAAPGGSYTTPDGRFFVVIGATEICLLEIESQVMECPQIPFFRFAPTTRPAFTTEGLMYVSSALNDVLLTFELATGQLLNVLEVGEPVERTFNEGTVTYPAGPLSVSISPDQQTIATVHFNANVVELFRPSFKFMAPQLTAENVGIVESLSGIEEPEIIPLAERLFTGVAVSNVGDQDAKVIFEAVGRFTDPRQIDNVSLIRADPIPVCDESGVGQTTISWDVTPLTTDEVEIEEVEIRLNSPDGESFTFGGPTGSEETGLWVTDGMKFFLMEPSTGEVLDFVIVDHIESGCEPPVIRSTINPIQVCEGEFGRATISWFATNVADSVEIRIGSPEGKIFTTGRSLAAKQTGQWVSDGMTFFLLDQSSGEVLDTVVVSFTRRGCLTPVTKILRPDEQISFTTDLLQPDLSRDFDGWIDIDSDHTTLAGIILTFDGELNRLDGAPIFSEPLQTAIFPEVRITDGFSTHIEVVNVGRVQDFLEFDLFDSLGNLVASSTRLIARRSRASFSVVGDPDDPTVIPLFDGSTPPDTTSLIIANPSPIEVCDGTTAGQTTIFWDVTGITLGGILIEEIEVRLDTEDGTLFITDGPSGSKETGVWVKDGMLFYLLDRATRRVLDTLTVHLTELGCPFPVILAEPNPIPVCDGGEFGQTIIAWDVTDVVEEVEIRLTSPTGTLMTTGSSSGFQATGRWVRDGMTFFVVNRANGESLDSVSVNLTTAGCPLLEFTDGYIRATGSSFVGFERLTDAKRMAVLAAQPIDDTAIHFVVPHFVALGASDTVLKLINPRGSEEEEGSPIRVSLDLRADDGSAIGSTVTVDLDYGESLRASVIELFGLDTAGELCTGWIDISTDTPGLLGSAQIFTFEGEASTAIPLEAVGSSRAVFSHVAQGLGFSTGLAIVNPEDRIAHVKVELRRMDSSLVGTVGPVDLEPRNRLISLIPELFPDSGEVIGGTVKVTSDGPVTGVELFYTNDLRLLSAVPGQEIE